MRERGSLKKVTQRAMGRPDCASLLNHREAELHQRPRYAETRAR